MNVQKSIFFWIALLLGAVPFLIDHVRRTWQLEQYHFLPALALVTVLIISGRWDRNSRMPSRPSQWALVGGGVLLSFAALGIRSSWLGALGALMWLGAWLLTQREQNGRSLGYIWPMTWLVMPLPLGFDASLTQWLQLKSTSLSSYSLDLIGIPHALFGNIIDLSQGRLFVEEACSGVQSLFTVIFLASVVVVGFRRPVALYPLYILAALVWAGAMNIMRIVAIAVAESRFSLDLAHGWKHEFLGYFCLAMASLLLLSSDRVFRVLFFPIASSDERGEETNPVVWVWNRFLMPINSDTALSKKRPASPPSPTGTSGIASLSWALPIAVTFSILLAGLTVFRFRGSEGVAATIEATSGTPFLNAPKLLNVGLGFVQTTHEERKGSVDLPYGEFADVWSGKLEDLSGAIVLSQPYSEWHDLCVCYTGIGMDTNSRVVNIAQGPDGEPWGYVMARFVDQSGKIHYIWFSSFDRTGASVDVPAESFLARWMSRIQASDSVLKRELEDIPVAMVQLAVEADAFLPAESIQSLTSLHLSSREILRAVANP